MKTIVVIPTYDEKDNVRKMADAIFSASSLFPLPFSSNSATACTSIPTPAPTSSIFSFVLPLIES